MGYIEGRQDIEPFFLPCLECNDFTFHGVLEERAGLTLGLIFVKKPLLASQVVFTAICSQCESLTCLDKASVELLAKGIIPKAIYAQTPEVAGWYESVYTRKTEDVNAGAFTDPEMARLWKEAIAAYELER